MRLYRPVGLRELLKIYDAGMRAFPPRLPEQPIFYPVLNVSYAIQIARDWNTKSGDLAGYVTQFDVADDYVRRFEPHVVGAREHQELWVPAEELPTFNSHVERHIEVVEAFFGDGFRGYIPERGSMRGMDAVAQFVHLADVHGAGSADGLADEVRRTSRAVFVHYPCWVRHDFTGVGIADERKRQLLERITQEWRARFPDAQLCYAGSGQ